MEAGGDPAEAGSERRGRHLLPPVPRLFHGSDRCAILLEALPGDLDILGRLDQLYEEWSMPAERAKIFICKALVAREAGEEDIVQRYVERAQSMVENLDAIPEYQKLFTANSELEPEGAAEMTEEEEEWNRRPSRD